MLFTDRASAKISQRKEKFELLLGSLYSQCNNPAYCLMLKFPFETCICFNVETIFSGDCHVFGLPSVLLFCFQKGSYERSFLRQGAEPATHLVTELDVLIPYHQDHLCIYPRSANGTCDSETQFLLNIMPAY